MTQTENENLQSVAIVGMAGRFPGANSVGEFWDNLTAGRNSITQFTDAELAAAGYDPEVLRSLPGYVAARGIVEKPEWFDRTFFGISPKEAELMDPQQRIFLEIAWEAMEDAGCDPSRYPGLIGVFAGMSINTYYPFFVCQRRDIIDAMGLINAGIANENDYLASRLAHKLDLRGPALNIQTACSASLVSVCVACQNLITRQCDISLAGGVSLSFPQTRGYFSQEGGMTSPDGGCRPFDSRANGTVFSSGAGIVVLKRLADALSDGDRIYAVIKGHAINNDGSKKDSFAAPSIDGQAGVIAHAQSVAGVSPKTISYVEAHGTGTLVGDPIEIAGLTQVFRRATDARQFCALGSVKGNIGHCDVASGIMSLIKTALALHHVQIPPSIGCERLNTALHLEDSPFFINDKLRAWPHGETPRRAGVSSFGIGGTNSHVVLEEAPVAPVTGRGSQTQVIVLSAKTAPALERRAQDLAAHLETHGNDSLADIAWMLQTGRQTFQHRRAVVARSHDAAAAALRATAKLARVDDRLDVPVALLFPGQGAQYAGMGSQLYEEEPVFRAALDTCAESLRTELGRDLREIIFSKEESASGTLRETRFTQPAIFAMDYAMGKLWLSLGVQPAALLGHSVGEFAAAALAGIFSCEDAARLVVTRARLVQELPPGAMLAVRLGYTEAREFLGDPRVDIAAVNSPKLCVFSGPFDAIEKLEAKFSESQVPARRLSTSHAFHSPMVEPAIATFGKAVRGVKLNAPSLPIVSTVTGKWMTPEEAVNPDYWASHLRATVRFADAVVFLLGEKHSVFIEAGPGNALSQLARQCITGNARCEIAHSIDEATGESESFAAAAGRAWLGGAQLDWKAVHHGEPRRRVSLSAYPFDRQRYFADLPRGAALPFATATTDGDAPPDAPQASVATPQQQPDEDHGADGSTAQAPPAANEEGGAFAEVKQLLGELSGLDLSTAPATTNLLELGFDSLFLTQVAGTLRKKFALKMTFRQLMGDLSSLGNLAEYIDQYSQPGRKRAPAVSAKMPSKIAEPASCSMGVLVSTADRPGTCEPVKRNGTHGAKGALACEDGVVKMQRIGSLRQPTGAVGNEETTFVADRPNVPDPETGKAGNSAFSLTEAQQGLWMLAKTDAVAARAYNVSLPLDLHGSLDVSALRRSIEFLAERHEALRTGIDANGETQRVLPSQPLALSVVDCIDSPDKVIPLFKEAENQLINLERGPFFRGVLARVGETRHRLMMVFHHVISNGPSLWIFVEELLAVYEAECKGEKALLEPVLQLRDYVYWRQSQDLQASEAYWLEMFKELPPALELPADHPRPHTLTYNGTQHVFTIDAELYGKLKQTGVELRCSMFMMLFSAFNILLHRLTGQDDVVVGVPFESSVREADNARHLFANTTNVTPLRSRINGDTNVLDYLATTKERVFEGMEHQEYFLGRLIKAINLPRDPARSPLFSAMFNFDTGSFSWKQDHLEIEVLPQGDPEGTAIYELFFNVRAKGGMLEVQCNHNTDLFEPETVLRWMGHYKTLLESIVANPRQNVHELPLLSEAERRRVLVEWNDTRVDHEVNSFLHTSIEKQSALTPDAVAVVFEGAQLSYAELNRRANGLSQELRGLGVGPDTLVGICTERSLEMVVGLLAILKSGGAYVPLDPDYPQERVAYMLAHAKAPVLLTQRQLVSRLPQHTSRVVCLDEFHGESDENLVSGVTSQNLAYVIYTSGSTGQPKGVEIPHRAIFNLLESMRERPGLTGSDTLLAVTTLSFDIAALEIFLPLICGAKIILATRETAMDARHLAKVIEKSGVTVMQATPATWRGLLAGGWSGSPGLKILCGGEAMPADLAGQLLPCCASLWNMYGPTETTVWSTTAKVEPAVGTVTVGRPIANTSTYILNASQQPQPVGVHGELYIGGIGVARGYLYQPELTASKFIPDPFGGVGERLYKTGDLARYRADGSIEFLGRLDHQVKVRGFRIELAEIESVLRRHPAVAQCVVVLREDRPGDKRLAAYVVPGRAGEEPDLRDFLKKKLPDYMMPSALVFVETLSLTPNGKVDRKALPAIDHAPLKQHEFASPNTPLEKQLTDLWSQVLGVPRVGVADDFFELGGDSLLAVTLFMKIEKKFEKKLPLATLFLAPTVRQLAAVIEQEGWSAPWSPLVAIQPNGKHQPFFCIHGADGGVLFYSKLAGLLGEDQPFYGLQAQGLDGGQIRHASMEAIATLYIKEIRSVQASGPYYLGGYSFGGILAMEMARQLRAEGEKVALLTLFDAINPVKPPRRYTLKERIALRSRVIAGKSLWQKLAYVFDRGFRKLAVIILVMRYRINRLAYKIFSKRKEMVASHYRTMRVQEAHIQALGDYRPSLYHGKLTLIRAENPNDGFEFDSELGWGGLAADGIEVHDVPGEHETIFHEPHVQILAATMKDCIEKARNAQGLK